MQFVALVGTNADQSYNRKLLAYMQRHFDQKATIAIYDIANIPLFREGVAIPANVQQLADTITAADGVIFATPEYDHSIPAALKSVIEWLSCELHPLEKKPIMIVGASLGIQGTSRAQQNLRQILDAPGVNAIVMPGDEFMLSFATKAFSENGDLKDTSTIQFLESCFNDYLQFCTKVNGEGSANMKTSQEKPVKWADAYDVIVLGFGAAGATAARFAADNGAKVLLADAAPDGHEGGNTRYAGQVVVTGHDYNKTKAYFKQLFGSIDIDEEILDTYVKGISNIPAYFKKYLEIKEPVSYNKVHRDPNFEAFANGLSPEYPEFEGSDAIDLTTVHDGYFDASLWKTVRAQVTKRSKQIDIWLSSPAKHLIQNATTGIVEGVQIERNGQRVNIQARNGVVMAMGGFENNPEYIQNFIGVPKLKVIGTLYNKGDGIAMAEEVGAKLWHMKSFEGYGFNTSFTFENPAEQRGKFILGAWPEMSHGSIFVAADDGSRYVREDENGRHGHAYEHGSWHNPTVYNHPHLIFDQAQYDRIKAQGELPYPDFFKITIKASSLDELASKINADPATLKQTVSQFNQFAEMGTDFALGRDGDSMTAFGNGPFYATPLATAMLNTQGGAQRNAKAEVLDASGQPIPHLYSAGEFGGINANQYNGGGNLAECLIFGKIAGENAAAVKTDSLVTTTATEAVVDLGGNDLASENVLSQFEVGPDQYLGVSEAGIGGQVVVRVTYADGTLKDVEVLKESESEDVGQKAMTELPQNMVAANTYEVDGISGASSSSRALKSAVKNAMSKIKQSV
ncbi:fumarate reductase flavoprotein subunit [Secundilactobacillus pentosiphilus]|uniref:Urocanate reductase n=1 Tax=Secundilactobacillus pentosiphilus TaxID=1714682 RepID=A0A1Z5IQZ1_9LACO|nr:NAD(P)H-dependent oxidoreductase [Secundilactobacillus pentosiphilus]GAX04183.1 fumarate reductase flavoprotein subunit [Secundilactobacillus pentosiphilus]